MVSRPKRRGKPPDHPADIALADAGCRRPTNPTAILAAHSRKPAELGGSRYPGSLGTLVAVFGERRDRRPSHDEQTEHDHDRVTRASGRHSLANGNEPGPSGTPPPEKAKARQANHRAEPRDSWSGRRGSNPRPSAWEAKTRNRVSHCLYFTFDTSCSRWDVARRRMRLPQRSCRALAEFAKVVALPGRCEVLHASGTAWFAKQH